MLVDSCVCGGQRQAEVGQGLLDDPAGELGIFFASFVEPSCKIAPDLREIAPIKHPAQLQQAVVADLAGNVIERVPEEVHIAALAGGYQ